MLNLSLVTKQMFTSEFHPKPRITCNIANILVSNLADLELIDIYYLNYQSASGLWYQQNIMIERPLDKESSSIGNHDPGQAK